MVRFDLSLFASVCFVERRGHRLSDALVLAVVPWVSAGIVKYILRRPGSTYMYLSNSDDNIHTRMKSWLTGNLEN